MSRVRVPNQGGEPLQDFPLFDSHAPDVARSILRRYGVDLIVPDPDGFFLRTNLAELPQTGLYFCISGGTATLSVPARHVALVHLCLSGHGRLTSGEKVVELYEGAACICSPGRAAKLEIEDDFTQLVLRIPQPVLERTIASLIGFRPHQPILFEPAIARDDPRYLGFRDLTRLLATRLDAPFSAWPKNVLLQLERSCITALLYCSRHNLNRLLDSEDHELTPQYLLRAENYAEGRCGEERWADEITVEELARAAGVSVSTLNRGFIRHRGYSPAAFIKRLRLARARWLLETGAARTVVGVALHCGFANPSRFANDYRAAFGESPTETLRRSR
jgi:AraC-like DNA-binding protein